VRDGTVILSMHIVCFRCEKTWTYKRYCHEYAVQTYVHIHCGRVRNDPLDIISIALYALDI
jgi:hypothetical protein